MILVLISILTIVVVGAICFWAIDRFATDRRLANLLKLLVILICLGAILQRVLPSGRSASHKYALREFIPFVKTQLLVDSRAMVPVIVIRSAVPSLSTAPP